MDSLTLLKKVFPFSFTAKKDVAALVISVLIYLAAGIVTGILIGLLIRIPFIGAIVGIAGSLADLYVVAGVVLTFLDYFKVLK